jgi:hypothetical protein
LVVGETARLREILVPVYAALGLNFDPRTAGSVEDAVPGLGLNDVRTAVLAEFGALRPLVPGSLEPATLALASELESWHAPGGNPRAATAGTRQLQGKTLDATHLTPSQKNPPREPSSGA